MSGRDSLMSPSILSLTNFRVRRPQTGFTVRLPDLDLEAGAAAALLGPSGCGKTTLLLASLGLAPGKVECEGDVIFDGRPLPGVQTEAWRHLLFRDVVVILQDARASLDPVKPLLAQIRDATGADDAAIVDALGDLGVSEAASLVRRYPHEVSGGQAQRILLSVALLRRPRLVVADEPAASLDRASRHDLVRCLDLLRERTGTALLIATHDHDLVQEVNACTWMQRGGTFERGDPEQSPWPVSGAGEPDEEVVIDCQGLGLRRGGRRILEGVNLRLRRGEILALVGPSGSGKTSLAMLLARHQRPSTGKLSSSIPQHGVQMLFQDARGSITPGRTVASLLRETACADFDSLDEAGLLGLSPELLDRPPEELSGGELRRAALLRALSVGPEVLILDEPTASLDRPTAVPVIEMLMGVRRRRAMTFVLITHDHELARAVAHRVVNMENGRLCD